MKPSKKSHSRKEERRHTDSVVLVGEENISTAMLTYIEQEEREIECTGI
jgi:hypothetical protein